MCDHAHTHIDFLPATRDGREVVIVISRCSECNQAEELDVFTKRERADAKHE